MTARRRLTDEPDDIELIRTRLRLLGVPKAHIDRHVKRLEQLRAPKQTNEVKVYLGSNKGGPMTLRRTITLGTQRGNPYSDEELELMALK